MFNFFAGRGERTFESRYRVYPVSFIDKPEAENGDKIFMPPSALDRLASLNIEYPMLFKLENKRSGQFTHTGVLEFIAEEGMLYVPYWVMQNLVLEEGDIATISSVTLPKGTFVKLQPHSKDFLDISNPKAVLERTLRGYSCLTKGDTICLSYNSKKFYIDIVEARPQDAISVIETDCEVEFAAPLDYVEPRRQPVEPIEVSDDEAGPSGAEQEEPAQPKFQAFVGQGMRLDGKPSSRSSEPAQSSQPPVHSSSRKTAPSANGAGNGNVKQKAGKVVFGGGNRLLEKKAAEGQPRPPEKTEKKEEPKTSAASAFQAFTGTGRSLRD